jgi:hypothetical protein
VAPINPSLAGSKNVTGSATSTFNFDSFIGLTTANVNPTISAAGGFSSFTINDLNNFDFAKQLKLPLKLNVLQYFVDLHFEKELIQLIFIQEYTLPTRLLHKIEADVLLRCANRHDPRTEQFCEQLDRDRAGFIAEGCVHFFEPSETATILNTARNLCSMTTFQIFERQLRFLGLDLPFVPTAPGRIDPTARMIQLKIRSSQGVLYYLGELIAAQNYSTHP